MAHYAWLILWGGDAVETVETPSEGWDAGNNLIVAEGGNSPMHWNGTNANRIFDAGNSPCVWDAGNNIIVIEGEGDC